MANSAPDAERCAGCGKLVCGRQQVISRILGGKSGTRCLECLGAALDASPEQLCQLVGGYLARRECYRKDWLRAPVCEEDGQAPCCPSRLENAPEAPSWYNRELFTMPTADLPEPDLEVDAEESGCGDLMVLLMRSIRKVPPGGVLRLTARDPGAGADIPSWCRMTGHELLAEPSGEDEADYTIRRKQDNP